MAKKDKKRRKRYDPVYGEQRRHMISGWWSPYLISAQFHNVLPDNSGANDSGNTGGGDIGGAGGGADGGGAGAL